MTEDPRLIAETLNKVAVASDEHDWDLFRSAFADRVHFDASRHIGAPALDIAADEFATMSAGVLKGFDGTHHALSNLLIDVDGDSARTRAYITAHHVLEEDGDISQMTMRGYWDVALQRVDGRWLITTWAVVRSMPLDGAADLYQRAAARTASAGW